MIEDDQNYTTQIKLAKFRNYCINKIKKFVNLPNVFETRSGAVENIRYSNFDLDLNCRFTFHLK